jgi:hypothetical protein
MIMGGQSCKGMSLKEAESERAYLAMLAALYEIQLAMPRNLSNR